MYKIAFALLLLLSVEKTFSQKVHTISGKIFAQSSGEFLIGASVYLLEQTNAGTLTNSYGFYSLSAPEGNYHLIVSFSSYNADTIAINLTKDVVKQVYLNLQSAALKEVVVTSRSNNVITRTYPGQQKISVAEIQFVPVIFGEKDILKTLQLLPGIKSGGDGQAGFFVRGGTADQNLILLDEANVYNASHLLGFFSTFNSDAIKDVTIYKGDMPAQYGGRLSSLLDVKMNDGNNQQFHVNGGIGLIASRLNLEGPLFKKKKGSFMISARRTYADLFLKASRDSTTNKTILYFYDINAKANYELNEKNKLYLSAYLGRDVLGFGDLFGLNWGNTTATLRWNHIFNSKLFSNTSFIYSNYNYTVTVNQSNNNVSDVSRINDYSLKEDLQYYISSKNKMNAGFEIIHHTFSPGVIATSSTSSFNNLDLPKKYSIDFAAYIANEWNISDKFRLNYGVRFSSFNVVGPGTFYTYDTSGRAVDSAKYGSGKVAKPYNNIQPRLAITYQLNKNSSVKISYSNNVQNLHLLSNSTGNSPTDLWISSSNNVKPELANQISAGYYKTTKNNHYDFSAEVYYKGLQNQIDYKNGAILVANQNVESQLLYGIGRAYGLELYAKKKVGRLTGWVSYTLSRTERKINNINNDSWYPATQDQTHAISIVGIFKLNEKWTLSSDFVYNTGNAVTWPTGKYNVNGNVYFFYSNRNANRMPAYNRLDFSATKTIKKTAKKETSLSLSLYNVYGRENPYFITFRTDPSNPQATQALQYSLFRWVPSITYNFKF